MKTIDSDVITELNPDGIVFINSHEKIEYINAAFSEITGYSSIDLIGLNEHEFNSQLQDLCENNSHGEEFDIKNINNSTVIQIVRPVRRLIKCTSRTINNTKDTARERVLYFHDITGEQEKNGHIRNKFLSAASHKLRTPLAGILGFSELLLKQDLNLDKQKEINAIIYRQSNNLMQIIDDYIDIEQLNESNGTNFHRENGTLEKTLNNALNEAGNISEQMKITFEPPIIWKEVNCDFNKINQVLINLVNNAIKYSPESGSIVCSTHIGTRNGHEEFGIRIRDQGIGISPNNLSLIGDYFYRVDDLKSVSGSGLGIAIVKKIISLHNGRFELTSIKGEGTTATVWLPVV